MDKEKKEYIVALPISGPSAPKTVTTEVFATSEADAINKAKAKFSLNPNGENYQVISGGSAILK